MIAIMMVLAEEMPGDHSGTQVACHRVGTMGVSESAQTFVEVFTINHLVSHIELDECGQTCMPLTLRFTSSTSNLSGLNFPLHSTNSSCRSWLGSARASEYS